MSDPTPRCDTGLPPPEAQPTPPPTPSPPPLPAETLAAIARYYSDKLAAHGPGPRGVDWRDADSQHRRHRQFLRLLHDDPDASVADVGCGYGDFLSFLRAAGHNGRYAGYDIAAPMIAAARRLHGDGPGHQFHQGLVPADAADYAVASGICNVIPGVPAEIWADHVWSMIDALHRAGRRGFGFNMLSLSSEPAKRRPDLFYGDPAAVLGQCLARYGRHVALLQDYRLWEFTVLVRR